MSEIPDGVITNDSIVSLRNISRVFGKGDNKVFALNRLSLDVHQGEFLAVMGASGSGKSTCMNIIGCLDKPTDGEYYFEGMEVGKLNSNELAFVRKHRIGFIFQGFNLLSRTSALSNVELPLIYQRVSKKERMIRSLEALHQVGLSDRAHHHPNQLSGGQQQRVAIARAIVTRPGMLVADEPTGNLDSKTKKEVMNLLVELNEKENITVVMVTHEENMAQYAGRKVEFIDGRLVYDSRSVRS
jgi:putative ABC transport system ATP-binding protein